MKNTLKQIAPFKRTFIPKDGADWSIGLRCGTTSVFWFVSALLVFSAALYADSTNSSLSPFKGAKTDRLRSRLITRTNTPSARLAASQGTWVLQEIGPDHKTWKMTPTNAQQSGRASSGVNRSGQRVVEIATGMNYFDGQNWIPSDPTFEITADAFVARRIQHKVKLNANSLNTIGAVRVTTPDGIVLHSTPVGIGLYDAASGQSAILARITDGAGALVSSNQVVYENAFNENGVQADIVYTIGKGSFEQDILFRNRLNPADYGFPTNTTRIQIFTEFYDAPQPDRIVRPIHVEADQRVRSRMTSPDLVDEILGFGELAIATGRARKANVAFASSEAAAPIVKQFTNMLGRTFLIESVEYKSIARELNSLPENGSRSVSADPMQGIKKAKTRYAAIPSPRSSGQVSAAAIQSSRRMASAEAFAKRPGVIIDLLEELTVNVTQTKTFRGDTTYVVSGQITCSAPVTIEGGAVFKYPSSPTAFIKLNNTLSCKTSSYHPAIFTAIDDDTVGDWAPGSSGSTIDPNTQQQIYYANPALHLYYLYSPSLSNLRFSHCREAVRIEANVDTSSATVSHSQFVNCVKGIVITGSGSGDGTATPLTVNNSLLAHVDYPLTVNVNAAESFIYHCTIDNSVQLITATGYSSFTFVNSVLANVTTLKSGPTSVSGNYNGFYNVTTSSQFGSNLKVLGPDDPSPFVPTTIVDPFGFDVPSPTTGEGGYYLTGSCPFKDAGTTTIPATLKADLSLRTTDPPIYFSEILYSDYTLREAVQRDVDIPNLGYHYDVVDYAVFRSSVFGCNLLVEPGVVCGFIFSDSTHGIQQYGYGLRIGSNARLVAEGTPSSPIVFARLSLVQENPLMGLQGHFQPILTTQPILEEARSLDPEYPIIQLRFVDFPAGPIDSILEPGYSWEQEFWTGDGGDWASWTYFTSISISDCQFRGGWIRLNSGADVARTIAIKNTLFERCSFFAGDLPPEYEWWVSSPEIGEQFSIYNCLFYGGHLQLIPVSAAPWKIRDNIFDQVTLFQNDTDPVLYHDHNAYIGMGGSRIKPAPDAAHDTDVLLTSLTYSTSTLGRFYLPSTASALFGAGSRPKVESGLGHYTSRTSQLRELDESAGNVNIGLHYVALVNQLPRDTDQDGLADYIEDTDGDGILDAGESNTATALADGCFPFGLATLPGSEWQGYVTLYADSKYSDWSLDQLTFFADGEPVPAQQTANLAGSRRIVVIDSRRLPNGSHGIQCRADFSTSNQQDPDGEPQQEILNSTPFTVTVNNVLAIPTWDREFGYDKFGMNGSVIGNPTGVEVRVYQMPQDVNAVPIWVRTLTAPVINGSIDLTWNMTDENGNPLYFDDEQQILFAAVKPTGGQGGTGGASSAGSKVRVMPDFPAKGMWLAAYQYVLTYFYNRETSLEAQGAHAIMAGIQGGIEGQSENNGGYFRPDIDPLFRDAQRYQYLWQPIPQITDWMRHKSVSEEAAANYVGDAWSLLLKCLGGSNKDIAQQTYLVRNFYFFGHHGKRIGGETYKGVGFTPQDLKMEREKNKKGPFRWAWIDGCSTEGKWAEAFGVSTKFRTKYTQSEIDKAEDPNERDQMLNHFLNIGLVPNAYMGWNQSKRFADSLNVGNLMANDLGGYRRDLISNFVGFGTTPKSIHLAIQLATQNNTTGVASWFAVEDGMVVYGFKYLKGDRFNDFSEVENFLKNGVKPPGY